MASKDGTGPNKFEMITRSRSGKAVLLSRWDGYEAWVPRWMWEKCNEEYEDMRTMECECTAENILEECEWREPRYEDEDDDWE